MIQVRPMREEDTESVSLLERQIFSCPWTKQGFADSLRLENTVFLAAEEDGRIVGYIGMYFALEEGEITNVAVAQKERRRGIGSLLVQRMQGEAGIRGITKLILEVRISNETAVRLYERNGFQICGTRKGFYERPKEDAYLMIYGQD